MRPATAPGPTSDREGQLVGRPVAMIAIVAALFTARVPPAPRDRARPSGDTSTRAPRRKPSSPVPRDCVPPSQPCPCRKARRSA